MAIQLISIENYKQKLHVSRPGKTLATTWNYQTKGFDLNINNERCETMEDPLDKRKDEATWALSSNGHQIVILYR